MHSSDQKNVQIFDTSKVILNLGVDTCAEGKGSPIVSLYICLRLRQSFKPTLFVVALGFAKRLPLRRSLNTSGCNSVVVHHR